MTASNPILMPTGLLNRTQARRLRDIHRSAGWPSQDDLELELLAAGCLDTERDAAGRTRLRLSPAGLQALQAHRERERARHDAHGRLVEAVARHLCRHGRVVWTELTLLSARASGTARASGAAGAWRGCRPDVFSIRHTSSPQRLEPVVHEIKVRRADLLADLKQPAKRAAYEALGACVIYVLGCDRQGQPIGSAEEVPEPCGVWFWRDDGPHLARPPSSSAMGSSPLGFATWMSLARAVPWQQRHGWSATEDQHAL